MVAYMGVNGEFENAKVFRPWLEKWRLWSQWEKWRQLAWWKKNGRGYRHNGKNEDCEYKTKCYKKTRQMANVKDGSLYEC